MSGGEEEEEEGNLGYFSSFSFHWRGTKASEALAVQRLLIISASHLKSKGGDRQWPRQEEDSLGSTDVGWWEKQRVRRPGAQPRSLLWKH